MADVKEALTGKLGPAPVYVWAIGASVPLIAYRLIKAKRTAAAAAASKAAAEADANGDDPSSAGGDIGGTPTPLTSNAGVPTAGLYAAGNPGGIYDTTGAASSPVDTGPTDNYSWINLATERMVASGAYSTTVVGSALRKVIEGTPVTDQEQQIFNQAVRLAGQPPSGFPPIQAASTVSTAPAAPIDPQPVAPAPAPTPAPYVPYVNPNPPPLPANYNPADAGQDYNQYDPGSGQWIDTRYVRSDGRGGLVGVT